MTFTSNSAVESAGFQAAVAVHFTSRILCEMAFDILLLFRLVIATCARAEGVFLCKNQNCISKELQGDGRNHCGDKTDEN